MNKKEQKILRGLHQMDIWMLEEWQASNDASSFSDEFVEEVINLRESLEGEVWARREEAMIYYRQEDRISDDPEIR
jgi:hypothetical protein